MGDIEIQEKEGKMTEDDRFRAKEELQKIIKETNKKFYLRPKFMMRKLTKIKSISQLIKQAHMAIALLNH